MGVEKIRHNVGFIDRWWTCSYKHNEHIQALETILKHETREWLKRAIQTEIRQLKGEI